MEVFKKLEIAGGGVEQMEKIVIDAVIVRDSKLLLVEKGGVWILPGGKKDIGETDLECLTRELGEELPELKVVNVADQPLKDGDFTGVTPHSRQEFSAKIYSVEVGLIEDDKNIKTAEEISKAVFTNNFKSYNLSNVTKNIISFLQEKNIV